MTQYSNENRGTLGRNKRKEKDTHPDYSGKINVDGVEYWLSGWLKEANGEKFFSLSVKPKEPRQDNRAEKFEAAVQDRWPGAQKVNDDIPW